jgi:histidinol dehydrogenase
MAYGTASVPPVYKIFGPGNQYVNCAKQLVQLDGVAIDMPAGPSEVCVIADGSANPAFVAADLISQAEHGVDSQVLLISSSESIVRLVEENIELQLTDLPRKAVAAKVLQDSFAIVFEDRESQIDMANEYASEHLILCCENARSLSNKIVNAGSVFIGNYSPEAAGDYASGTNHTLPTNGHARAYSGLSVDSFCKRISYQQLSVEGLNLIGDAVITMAEAEGLQGHANAIKIRK